MDLENFYFRNHCRISCSDITDIAEGLKESLYWLLSFPGVQAFWKNNSEFGFSSKFKVYVNELISHKE